MGLTSRALEYVVLVTAVLCVVLTVWLWPLLAGRGLLPVLGRFVSIGVTQLAIVCALALGVNSAYEFYGSWDELLGRNEQAPAPVIRHSGRDVTAGVRGGLVQAAGPQGLDRVPGLPTGPPEKAGRVESVRIMGRRTRVVNPAFVYLPPQYFQRQFRRQRFPVVVAISGYPGGIINLAQYLRVPQTAGRLISRNAMPPTVVVMVRPTIAPPRDTECVDVPGGPQAETFFTKDLPDALKSTYRVGHDPSAWGALGYSSGGTCALQLAMRNPHVYTAAAAFSADYRVRDDLTTGRLFGSGPRAAQRQREHDLFWRLAHRPVPRISVLVASSKRGEGGYPDTMRFVRAAKPPMSVDSLILPRGSHHFTTWRQEITPAMKWMGTTLTFPQDVAPRPHKNGRPAS
ncbi:alpha/beta hydrolase [Streptomyces olivaceiscleroticus]|uniref:Alpha/beta hydrolase-fold protein n=1 Tax=Streptomyces olivaceiscleroticus TaxID=68245 RepID=A0ABN0ZHX1_9ACTN